MLTGLNNEVDEVADVVVAVLIFCDRFLGLLMLRLTPLKGSHLPRQLIRKESRVEM